MMKTALSIVLLRKWMHATKFSDVMTCNQVVLIQNPRNVRPGQVKGLSYGIRLANGVDGVSKWQKPDWAWEPQNTDGWH